jgi:hypothetical protein
MKKTASIWLFAMLGLLMSSCTVGRKMNFENKTVNTGYTKAKDMSVGFLDLRADVVSGKAKPSYCGKMLSSAHIPYPMETEGGKALAVEFAQSVASSLQSAGVKAAAEVMPSGKPSDTSRIKELIGDKERLVLVQINRWESVMEPLMTTIRYEVNYDFDMTVYDRNGTALARKNMHEMVREEPFELAGSVKHLQEISDRVFTDVMKQMFLSAEIKAALMRMNDVEKYAPFPPIHHARMGFPVFIQTQNFDYKSIKRSMIIL